MVRSRTQPRLPVPKLPIWKKDGKLFYADRSDLECAIELAAAPDGLIRMRMGGGYHRVVDALNGARLDCWAVSFIEMGRIHRVTLYRMLSKGGNPSVENLLRIVAVVGLRMWVVEEDFFARRQKVVRPKDVVPEEVVKVSRGRQIKTRSRYDKNSEDKW